jgi:hypothetical protein
MAELPRRVPDRGLSWRVPPTGHTCVYLSLPMGHRRGKTAAYHPRHPVARVERARSASPSAVASPGYVRSAMKMCAWFSIPGHPGYQVSSDGRIRSVDRIIIYAASRGRSAYTRMSKGRLLKPHKMRDGHLQVVLGRGFNRLVHRMVALTFLGPCPKDKEVLHINGVPDDNRPVNLRYGTRSENLKDDYKRGIRGPRKRI